MRCPVNPIIIVKMTNVTAGHKRTWDGVDDEQKRSRAREDPKDWRDVYLDSQSRKPPPTRRDSERHSSSRRHSRDRRPGDGGRRRESDYKRTSDTRERSKRDDRDYHKDRSTTPSHRANAAKRKEDDEKEEGE